MADNKLNEKSNRRFDTATLSAIKRYLHAKPR